jgi:hypothetical protein
MDFGDTLSYVLAFSSDGQYGPRILPTGKPVGYIFLRFLPTGKPVGYMLFI